MLKAVAVLVIIVAVAAGVGFYVMTSQHAPATTTTSSPTTSATTSSPATITSASSSTPSSTSTTTTQPSTTFTTTQQITTSSTQTTTTTAPATSVSSTTPATTTSTTSLPSTTSTTSITSTSTSTITTSSATSSTTSTSTTTTSTTSTTTTTSTTATATTTTTPAQEVDAKALTLETILKNYEKITLSIHYVNKTTNEETNVNVTMTQEPGGSVGGVDTVKVVFMVSGDEHANLTLWMSKDYSTVVKIEANGQTVEGQVANIYGQQILRQANAIFMPYAYVGDIKLKIASDTATAMKAGWEVTSVAPTTVTISGHSYKAYSVAVKNVADTDSPTSDVELTVTEISPNVWVLTYMHANMKDGSTFTGQILELVPKT